MNRPSIMGFSEPAAKGAIVIGSIAAETSLSRSVLALSYIAHSSMYGHTSQQSNDNSHGSARVQVPAPGRSRLPLSSAATEVELVGRVWFGKVLVAMPVAARGAVIERRGGWM